MIFENDDGVGLVDAHEMWMGVPEEGVGVPVDASELNTALSQEDLYLVSPPARMMGIKYGYNSEKHGWCYLFTALS